MGNISGGILVIAHDWEMNRGSKSMVLEGLSIVETRLEGIYLFANGHKFPLTGKPIFLADLWTNAQNRPSCRRQTRQQANIA